MKKALRFIGILFMGITSAVTLLGGVGTTCVALDATKYESMKAIAEFQWLYILYVLAGIALGVMGIRATIQLIKGKENAEKSALMTLVLGIVVGVVHIFTSRVLRGSSMPVDGVVYITVLTLVIFLLFRLPKVQQMELFQNEVKDDTSAIGGLSAIIIGGLVLSVQMWAGSDHFISGINYADAFHNAMFIIGTVLELVGVGLITKSVFLPRKSPAVERSAG